ncbi:MAG: thioredoxin domain-containing protein [Mycobacteriaceae bacterium]|nr:thioredoxin domain-containing protein [Mycobacteriaceae bacterium]
MTAPKPAPVSSRTTWLLAALAVVAVALTALLVLRDRDDDSQPQVQPTSNAAERNPALVVSLAPDGAQQLGLPNAAKVIDVYEDPLCPVCSQFEQMYGARLDAAVDQGKIAVRYHLLNFLDKASHSKDYSTRAIAAFRCVAQTGNGLSYTRFHNTLFLTSQPQEEGSSDLSNQQLADLAKKAGAPDAAVKCVADGAQVGPARQAADTGLNALKTAMKGGPAGTPTVMSGDTKIDLDDSNWILKLIP